jgi:hypothetical protein
MNGIDRAVLARKFFSQQTTHEIISHVEMMWTRKKFCAGEEVGSVGGTGRFSGISESVCG